MSDRAAGFAVAVLASPAPLASLDIAQPVRLRVNSSHAIYHCTRDSIEAHSTVVFAAMAVTR